MRFFRKIEGVTTFDKHRNTAVRESVNIESLLLRIERFQLRWFCHVNRISQGRLPKQTLNAKVNEKGPVGRPQTRWLDYIKDLSWNRMGRRPSEMQSVLLNGKMWRLDLELFSRKPQGKADREKRYWKFTTIKIYEIIHNCMLN